MHINGLTMAVPVAVRLVDCSDAVSFRSRERSKKVSGQSIVHQVSVNIKVNSAVVASLLEPGCSRGAVIKRSSTSVF